MSRVDGYFSLIADKFHIGVAYTNIYAKSAMGVTIAIFALFTNNDKPEPMTCNIHQYILQVSFTNHVSLR